MKVAFVAEKKFQKSIPASNTKSHNLEERTPENNPAEIFFTLSLLKDEIESLLFKIEENVSE